MKRIQVVPDRITWWSPVGAYRARPGAQVYLPGGTQVVRVDPLTTSPNVIVGIAQAQSDLPVYLRPGEFLELEKETRSIWVHNPLQAQLYTGVVWTPPLGFVSLLAGSKLEAAEWRPQTRPLNVQQLIAAGPLQAKTAIDGTLTNPVHVPTIGLEKLRLSVAALNNVDQPLSPPADFAATLRLWRNSRIALDATGAVSAAGLRGANADTGAFPAPLSVHRWCEDVLSDVVLSQHQTTVELDVGTGGLVYFEIQGLAGVNVTSAWLFAEGV